MGEEDPHGWIDRATCFPAMSLCAYCGQTMGDRGGLCAYHTFGDGGEWATGNRIMCDFVHRGIVSLTPREPTHTSIEVLGLEAALAA